MSKRTEEVEKRFELVDRILIADLERKLSAMVDERLASLERRVEWLVAACGEEGLHEAVHSLQHRVDLLYRYTVGDKTGWRYPMPPFGRGRGDEFPAPDYDYPGGPTKPPAAKND